MFSQSANQKLKNLISLNSRIHGRTSEVLGFVDFYFEKLFDIIFSIKECSHIHDFRPLPLACKRQYQKKTSPSRDLVQDNEDEDSEGKNILLYAYRIRSVITDDVFYLRRHTIADMTVAAYGMVICGTDDMHQRYRGRIEKVKFGVPISEALSHDIPATLLVLLLKVNKEGPLKKDIWRAPGNQAQVRKLSHIMQHGRLVNISNISVYTAASVIKVRDFRTG